jgi:hypothetical protein
MPTSRVANVTVQAVASQPLTSTGMVQISVKGKQVHIVTPTMQATCDRITSMPTSPHQVIMEGNVRVIAPDLKVEARSLIVDIRSGEFKAANGGITDRTAHQFGVWYSPNPTAIAYPPPPVMPPMPPFYMTTTTPHPIPVSKPVYRMIAPTSYQPQMMPSSLPR